MSFPSEDNLPIFHQKWWLSISTNNHFHIKEVKDSRGNLLAYFPYYIKKTYGLSVLRMPKYTRFLGPVLYLPPSKPFRKEQRIRHIVEKILSDLPRHDGMRFYLPPDHPGTFAFSLCGLKIEHDYTFQIPVSLPLEDVWDECDHKTRNLIRTAQKRVTVERSSSLDEFIQLSKKERSRNTHNFPLLKRLVTEGVKREQIRLLHAYTEDRMLVASCILIWDKTTLYYWQAARDHHVNVAGSNMLLIWEAMKLAKELGLIFDFDGYSTPATAKMQASFGQLPTIRPYINHGNIAYRLERFAHETLRPKIAALFNR